MVQTNKCFYLPVESPWFPVKSIKPLSPCETEEDRSQGRAKLYVIQKIRGVKRTQQQRQQWRKRKPGGFDSPQCFHCYEILLTARKIEILRPKHLRQVMRGEGESPSISIIDEGEASKCSWQRPRNDNKRSV